jgi:integrase
VARKKPPRKVTKARKAPRAKPRRVIRPAAVVTDVVAQLRANRFKDCLELPDRVLRSIASKAANTRLAVHANYRIWKAWCAAQQPPRAPYPAEPADVAAFLQAQAPPIRVTRGGDLEVLKTGFTATGEPAKRYATLARYLGTLSKLHIDGGQPDATRDPEVLAVWRVLRRGLDRPAQKAALGFEAIRQALSALPLDDRGKRDRALVLLAYTLMARRSELVALDVENFDVHADGSATVTFERLKTGERATNYLSPEVMQVVRAWLDAAGIQAGPIFIRKDFAGAEKPTRLTAQSVALIFKRIARSLALPDLDPSQISSHSARIGATHDLVEDGASDAAIMRDAGWKTPRMVGMYSRGAKAKRGAMAARLERLAPSFAIERERDASTPQSDSSLPPPGETE